MNKQVLFSSEARNKILTGAKKITDAIRVTLGPQGKNVVISQSAVVDYGVHSLPIINTKDGFHVAQAFDISDAPFEKAGVLMIKECTHQTVSQAGDSTTSTAILCYHFLDKGIQLINKGANSVQLKKGIDKAVAYIVSEIEKMAIPVAGNVERIRQVASIAANNDSSVGDLIADAFAKIGDYGVISIEEAKGVETEIKIAEGIKIDRGWVSPFFITNREKQTCQLDNPVILMYQNKITHHTQYEKAVKMAFDMKRPILIICQDADEEGLQTLVMNKQMGSIQCCIIRSPEFGAKQLEAMEDIATATGGKYISDSKGVGIKEIDESYFGQAKKVVISKDETIIYGGVRDESKFEELINELKMNLTQAKDENEKWAIEKRIATLTGGIAVIYVGAATETEMKEKKDRVDDAVRATKAAISEGVIVGGGTAFLRVKNEIQSETNADRNAGIELVFDSLKELLLQICENAGEDGEQILQQVVSETGNMGYNANTNQIEDLFKSGVIDPVKVLRCSIQNAASSSGMMLISEVLIVDTL